MNKQIEGFGRDQKLGSRGKHHNNVGDERFTRNPCFSGSSFTLSLLFRALRLAHLEETLCEHMHLLERLRRSPVQGEGARTCEAPMQQICRTLAFQRDAHLLLLLALNSSAP